MSWQIQVKVARKWRAARPTGGKPYEYPTKQQAVDMLWICYPGLPSKLVRVVKEKDREANTG